MSLDGVWPRKETDLAGDPTEALWSQASMLAIRCL